MSTREELVRVRTYTDMAIAEIDRGLLEANDVRALVSSDDCGGMHPGLTPSTGVSLSVNRSDLGMALDLLGLAEVSDTEAPASDDFYCDFVLSGEVEIERVHETENVLAYHHTRPFWPVHIVVIPKRHVPSLIELGDGAELLPELLEVVREVATSVTRERGAARVLTNLGEYQDSKHLHFHVSWGDPLR